MTTVGKPYYRTCRQHVDGSYANNGQSYYILDDRYAESPGNYIRTFLILQDELKGILEYIEPDDSNLSCYSIRLYELIVRASIEIEANFKAILLANNYKSVHGRQWTMNDYKELDRTHRLSHHRAQLPFWGGTKAIRRPFESWSSGSSPNWYRAYNSVKHDRHQQIKLATFGNAVDAMAALVCVLSAQFYTHDFQPGPDLLAYSSRKGTFDHAIGGYFLVEFPNWEPCERYEFHWEAIKKDPNPFRTLW